MPCSSLASVEFDGIRALTRRRARSMITSRFAMMKPCSMGPTIAPHCQRRQVRRFASPGRRARTQALALLALSLLLGTTRRFALGSREVIAGNRVDGAGKRHDRLACKIRSNGLEDLVRELGSNERLDPNVGAVHEPELTRATASFARSAQAMRANTRVRLSNRHRRRARLLLCLPHHEQRSSARQRGHDPGRRDPRSKPKTHPRR
jgi:hypothetical protein